MTKQNNIIVATEKEAIKEFFEGKSELMCNYIKENKKSKFTLIHKRLAYADIMTRAKRKNMLDSFDLDVLMYLTTDEMNEIGAQNLGIAKQSNINLPPVFYKSLGIEQLQRRAGPQKQQHEHILINDYAEVFLVNESLKYFNYKYSRQIFDKLNKKVNWKEHEMDVKLSEGDFTPIELRHAIHGIGTKKDTEFHKLRHNMFRNDNAMFLIETRADKKFVFIYLEKNPIFFNLLGIANEEWINYLKREEEKSKNIIKNDVTSLITLNEEKTRTQQNKWRNMLADEVMNYSVHDGDVFCAFTQVTARYETLGTIFRASHIKRFENCTSEEAFDVNNGLLLSANADALFDKFLITVSEEKELIYSFLIQNNYLLLQNLMLDRSVFKLLLNDERMKYMEWHRNQFFEKEKQRKGMNK